MRFLRTFAAASLRRVLSSYGLLLINPLSRYGLDHLTDVQRLARAWGRSITTIFDVGANNGACTQAFIERFPEAIVVAFEPFPDVFYELESRFQKNNVVKVEQLALANEASERPFYVVKEHPNLSSLSELTPYVQRFGQVQERIMVRVSSIDSYCIDNKIEHIDLLKIDTEGGDLDVLHGAQDMLRSKAIKFIYVEFSSLGFTSGSLSGALSPISALLEDHGYVFIASYNDYIITDGEFFAISNALFALPPTRS